MSVNDEAISDSLKSAINTVDFLLQQSRTRYPAGLPPYHQLRLNAWRAGKTTLPEPDSGTHRMDNSLQETLEIHRSYAEALLVHEVLRQIELDAHNREQLIQRALGILPASEAERFSEIHSCPALTPRNIGNSTEKLLGAVDLATQILGSASAFAYAMFIVAGLRARTEFVHYGKKIDTLFEKIISAPAVVQALEMTTLNGRRAGFEPQFRLLLAVRERLWELKPSRLAPAGFLLTKVIDAYLSNRSNAGNVLGLAVLDGIIIGKFGFEVRYIYESGVICIEVLIDNRSVYWDPTRPDPLSFTPIVTGKRLSVADLIGLTFASIAGSYFTQSYWDKAIENYRRVLELIPDSVETYADLANCYLRKNMPDRSIATLETALKIAPNSDIINYVLGNAYALANQWRQAVNAYKKALKVSPKFPEAWYNMGLAYEKMGTPYQAVAAFKMAIELKPDYSAAYLALGNLQFEQHNFTEAIDWYQEVLKVDSNLVAAYYNLGRAYYELKDLDSAIQAYQKAIKLNPKHAGAWHNLGVAYRDKGLKDKAVEALEQAISLNPNLLR